EINQRLRGVSRMESLEIILEKASKNFSNEEKLKMADKKNKIYQEYLKQMTCEDLSLEVKETLEKLRENNLKLAIGSSSKNTRLILKQIGLDGFFDAISDGTMIEYSKPHPEVFMKAAEFLNLDCRKCLVVEDAEAGCISAKSASMDVVGISSAMDCKYADYSILKFSDLISII
ncbi:HAD-IA family hydrolase, partial [Clostridium saudiense]|nr:HAD-IA family hydrolase [Clostridium saudiense]